MSYEQQGPYKYSKLTGGACGPSKDVITSNRKYLPVSYPLYPHKYTYYHMYPFEYQKLVPLLADKEKMYDINVEVEEGYKDTCKTCGGM